MDFTDKVDRHLKQNLSNKRYNHSVEVAKMAKIIADKLEHDSEKAYLAGLCHDIARELPLASLMDNVYNWGTFSEDFYTHTNLYHGPVGAYILQSNFGVTDSEILEAVAYHSIGHKDMCDIAKVVYVADYISMDRKHINESLRNSVLSMTLDKMVITVIDLTSSYLNDRGIKTLIETDDLYNTLERGIS